VARVGVVGAFLAVVGLTAAEAGLFCGGERVVAVDGRLQLARRWRLAFAGTFDTGLEAWRVSNFENRLDIGTDPHGERGARVRIVIQGQRGNTAFELTSPPVPVASAGGFRLTFSWQANRSLTQLSGHKGLYESQLQWLDGQGAGVGVSPIVLGPASPAWRRTEVSGTAPVGAANALVRFGCDEPNLEDQEWVAFDDLRFEVQSPQALCEASGEALSRPLYDPGKGPVLSWDADVPDGTRLTVRVATADDVQGVPGQWSDLVGPDGTTATAFAAAGALPAVHGARPWRRYAVTLSSADPARTPALCRGSRGGPLGADLVRVRLPQLP